MSWKPSSPFVTPLMLLVPTESKAAGVHKKSYPKEGPVFFASFKTYGGTESVSNGVLSVEDTAVVETTFRPDIKANCRIFNPINKQTYDILGTPENIEMRGQYLRFKVKAIKGGA